MRPTDPNNSDGHIPVHWLDTELPPTRWERLSRAWANLPGALVVALVVCAVIVPRASISLPGVPDVSLPAMSVGSDGARDLDIATPVVGPSTLATAVEVAAPLSRLLVTPTPAPAVEAVVAVDPAEGEANELGGVPIIMYHAFVHDPALTDEWTLTFDQFRAQLDWFREHDFVMVGM